MNLGGKNMFNGLYLFLIDYGNSLLLHPITTGFGLLFYIFLWQVIGTFIFLYLGDFVEPLQKKLNLKLDYFTLILACLTGCFTAIYFIASEDDDKVYGRAFRTVGVFGMVFLFFIPVTIILGAGIIIPVYSVMMWIVNGIISILPVLAGLAVIMPIVFFGGILSIVGAVAGRI